jgi:hypothetical protein
MKDVPMNVSLDNDSKQLVQAFTKTGFTLRSVKGLTTDSGLTKEKVQDAITRLMAVGLVDQFVGEKGVRFFLTSEGRKANFELQRVAQ